MPIPRLEIRVRDRRSGAATDHSFMHGPVRIGRDPACELPLADPYVSNQHALLETDEHGARLVDLGGTNGLRVAGRRLAPHAEVPVGERLCVSLGPFDLEVVHTPDRDRQAVSGALAEPGPVQLEQLHASLRHLHALHAPHVAARRAFEAALADAFHTFHAAGDLPAIRRILAEFPATDHAHLTLTTTRSTARRPPEPTPSDLDLSLRTSLSRPAPLDALPPHPPGPRPLDAPHLSLRTPPSEPRPLDAPDLPPPSHPPGPDPLDANNLSLRTSPSGPRPIDAPDRPCSDPRSPTPHLNPAAAPRNAPAPALALIADAAQALLPDRRPPANLDEARRFLDRLIDTLRNLAAGVGALQHLRLQQARDLDLATLDLVNPLLSRTSADELLTDLLAWREDTDRSPELLDAFAVLAAHARAHICAALAATRHLAAELAPLAVERHAPRSLLRSRACWHSFRDRYTACLGDGAATSGTLRASFRAAYLEELNHCGLPAAPRKP